MAGQLGRPVSYFLDETPSNLLALQETRIRADPGEALRALEGYQPDGSAYDDLAALLESILCLAASDQAAAEGRLPYARSLAAPGKGSLDPVRLSGRRPGSGGPSAGGGAGWGTRISSRLQRRGSGTGRLCCWLGSAWLRTVRPGPWPCWREFQTSPCSRGRLFTAWADIRRHWSFCAVQRFRQRRKRLLLSGSCWRPAAGSLAITGALMNTPPSSAHRRGPDLLKVGQHASYPLCFHPSPGACIPGRLFV